MKDVLIGARALRRSPGFAAAAIATLALGIGANAAMFTVLNATLLRPLPYREPGRLVLLQEAFRGRTVPMAPATYFDYRAQARSFESMAAAQAWTAVLATPDSTEQIPAIRATARLFDVLGVKPALGRTFAPDEDQPGKNHVVVLSDRLWRTAFGADPAVLQRSVTLNSEPYTVIGVMPPDFEFPTFWAPATRFWAPLDLSASGGSRGERTLRVFARLKMGASIQQARAETASISAALAQSYPDTNAEMGSSVESLHERTVGNVQTTLWVIAGAVGFLLLIACANVGNLLLSRSAARRRELAVRVAIGASKSRLVRLLLSEGAVLAATGGVVGAALATWGVPLLLRTLQHGPSNGLPRAAAIGVDGVVLLFVFGVSGLCSILFALAPAMHAARVDLNDAMKDSSRGSGSTARSRMRDGFVVAQLALSLILLAGAGVLLRSFERLVSVDPGYDAGRVLTVGVPYSGSRLGVPGKRMGMYRDLIARVRAMPGVESASAVNHIPIAGDNWNVAVFPEGSTATRTQGNTALYRVAEPGYFRTMRMRLLSGRDFAESDNADAPRAAIVNESAARRFWNTLDVVGKRFRQDPAGPWVVVVGLIADTRQIDLARPASAEVFFPYAQDDNYARSKGPFFYLTLVMRVHGDPLGYVESVRREIRAIDPGLATAEVASMEQVVARSVWQPRFALALIGVFAILAVALAAVGVYGVVAFAVSQRTREFGIRLALGAAPRGLIAMVLRDVSVLVAAGVAIGIAGSVVLSRLMQPILFQTAAADTGAMSIAVLVLALCAVGASLAPAFRAARVQPVRALRYE